MTSCCFTGHRTIPPAVREELTAILDRRLQALYDVGFVEFRAGGAIGFDTLAAERVLALRERHPDCRLVLMLPCRDQSKYWNKAQQAHYDALLEKADRVIYVREHYTPDCMHARNRALVDGSDLCIAYLTENRGGTLYTCSYALKQGVLLRNLYDELQKK